MKHIYFVGIKGVGMAALAIYCKEAGMKVSGCDTAEEFPTDDELKKANIPVDFGFDPQLLKKADLVIYTGAHEGRDNPVVVKARERGIETLPHGKALGMFMEGSRQITVAGSHGKTTTAAMIATILKSAGKDPSYAIGAGAIGESAAGHFGKANIFIAEGDEYVTDHGHDETPRFLWQKPELLVVTNIDFDHPDVYANIRNVQDAFVSLQEKSSTTIINRDDHNSRILREGISFGFSPQADFRITHSGVGRERMFFTLEQKGVKLGEFALKVPGAHNVSNATAAVVTCQALGILIKFTKDFWIFPEQNDDLKKQARQME